MSREETARVTVSAKGWVVIPAPLRRKYGIAPGSTVEIKDAGGKILLLPRAPNPVDEVYGMLADGRGSLTEALLAERAQERERDQAKIRS